MRKKMRYVGHFFMWVIYFMVTTKERRVYLHSLERGGRAVKVTENCFGTFVKVDMTQKPKPDYVTWREYWDRIHYQEDLRCQK